MTIGSLGYVVNDALIRVAADEGLNVYQALCLRGIAMTVLFAGFGRARRVRISRDQLQRPLLVRIGAELVASALFFAGIVRLDFANAQTILSIVPFAVTLVAALTLGERVSPRRYLTVLIGFAGVVLVVRPATEQFSIWSLVVLASAAVLVVREFATQRVDPGVPASTISLLTAIGLTLLTGVLSAIAGWGPLTSKAIVALAFACLFLVVGYVFTIQTVRVGELSVSAPFRYTTLLGAVVLGYVVFDEVPDGFTIIGCSVIVGSGLYALYLERSELPLVRTGR